MPNEAKKFEIRDFDQKLYSYSFRSTCAQFVASLFVGITYFGIGVLFMMPTVVVGNLLNAKNEVLSLNEEEGSWLGGLPFLVMPAGAILGILLQDLLGQRYCLVLSNLMGLISLIIMYLARSTTALMISSTLIGMSIGFMEPSGMSYISEYCEPKVRGVLSSGTMFLASLGVFFESLIVAIVEWRTGTLICTSIPILSILLLLWVPDSPTYLLSKGKRKKALKALMWFRGWVTENEVAEEFDDLCVYVRKSFAYTECRTSEEWTDLTGTPTRGNVKKHTLSDLLMGLCEKRTLYPVYLLCVFQTVIMVSCSFGATMYVLNLCDALHISIDRGWATFAYGAAMSAGNLSVTLWMKYTGKRLLAIFGTFFTSLTSIALGAFVHYKDRLQMPWLFIVLVFLLNFVASHCRSLPFLMMGEVFSVKNRHIACGLTGAVFDVIIFVFIKTYFTLDGLLGTVTYFLANGVAGFLGTLYLYLYLPETEGKSLAEIDRMFSARS